MKIIIGRFLIQEVSVVICFVNLFHMIKFPVMWPFVLFNILEITFLTASLLKRPLGISKNNLAWIATLAMAVFPTFVVYAIHHPINATPDQYIVSNVLQYSSLLLELWAILTLRSSFTMLPEAHRLVHNGPYRWVRHPLYTAYVIELFGLSIAVMQPLIWILFLLFVMAETVRAIAEEKVLKEFNTGYLFYAKKTGRFFPKIKNGGVR